MYELDIELFSGPSPFSLFRLCVAYFDRYPILNDATSGTFPDLKLTVFNFLFAGGTCSDAISKKVTHVIVSSW